MTIEKELSALMDSLSEQEADRLFEGRSVPSDPAAEERIRQKFMARLAEEPADRPVIRQHTVRFFPHILAAAAACLVVGLSAVFFLREKPPVQPDNDVANPVQSDSLPGEETTARQDPKSEDAVSEDTFTDMGGSFTTAPADFGQTTGTQAEYVTTEQTTVQITVLTETATAVQGGTTPSETRQTAAQTSRSTEAVSQTAPPPVTSSKTVQTSATAVNVQPGTEPSRNEEPATDPIEKGEGGVEDNAGDTPDIPTGAKEMETAPNGIPVSEGPDETTTEPPPDPMP